MPCHPACTVRASRWEISRCHPASNTFLVRRRDHVGVIVSAIEAKAGGESLARIASRLGHHVDTVRGWLRAFCPQRRGDPELVHEMGVQARPTRRSDRARAKHPCGRAISERCSGARLSAPLRSTARPISRLGAVSRNRTLQHEHPLSGVPHSLAQWPPRKSHKEDARRRAVGLFRYSLVREVADPRLSKAEQGAIVRTLAGAEHNGPDSTYVRYRANPH